MIDLKPLIVTFIALLCVAPFAIWKLIEIIIWILQHVVISID